MTWLMYFFQGVPLRKREMFFVVFEIYYCTFWRFMTSVQPLWNCKMGEYKRESVCGGMSVGVLEQ